MSTDAGIDRNQTKDAESVYNTRQDRNTFMTGGGNWSWSLSSGTLSWSDIIYIYLGGSGGSVVQIPAGSVPGMGVNGVAVVVELDRATPGIAAGPLTRNAIDALNFSDDALILGVRGMDERFYLRDGTILSDGEVRQLGALDEVTDRVDQTGSAAVFPNAVYVLGRPIAPLSGGGNSGSVDASGLIFTDPTELFLTDIPNTGGIPDTPTVIDIVGDGVYRVSTVDSNVQLTLTSPATPAAGPLTFYAFDKAKGYEIGTDQLLVQVNGAIYIKGLHYTEVGVSGISYLVSFNAGFEPGVGVNWSAINLAGGQGPAGPDTSHTLQDVYDASGPSKKVSVSAGKPVVVVTPTAGDTAFEVDAGAGSTAKLLGGGVWIAQEFKISDGSGSFFRLRVSGGGELLIEHESSSKGWKMDKEGRFSPFYPASSDVFFKTVEYSGSFDGTPSPVSIATGLSPADVYGILFKIEDQASSAIYLGEVRAAADAAAEAIVWMDSGGNLKIDADFAGGDPGADFASGDWTVLLFHGAP
jgi:hypothetical protein